MSKISRLQIEEQFLSKYATLSKNSRGRLKVEEECPLRTDFQRDRDRITHSRSFRRLKNKTQVFFSADGDHFRTRLTHTLDVSQIARSIANALELNENLSEAIALGHDLGHTPFGHSGERVLDILSSVGFKHNEQSLRLVDVLEKDGAGLNLTFEVRDGILNHKMSLDSATLEGQVVSIADWIAYINHDIEDSIRSGVLSADKLPQDAVKVLGVNSRERINTMINSIFTESFGKNHVKMEDEVFYHTKQLRAFMFETVYFSKQNRLEEEKVERMITDLWNYYHKNLDKMPEFYVKLLDRFETDVVVCDFLSGMSDKYATFVFSNLFIPKSWGL